MVSNDNGDGSARSAIGASVSQHIKRCLICSRMAAPMASTIYHQKIVNLIMDGCTGGFNSISSKDLCICFWWMDRMMMRRTTGEGERWNGKQKFTIDVFVTGGWIEWWWEGRLENVNVLVGTIRIESKSSPHWFE
ncbi:unnamed protein product [Anisakis simplex]|uniref:Transmembrane protein n=1 Tax=Anisakis simplex TaxID=6269 RepID=A0A0M3J4J9_ANISI|nr:unnamed protein product [Anisakis simplex]